MSFATLIDTDTLAHCAQFFAPSLEDTSWANTLPAIELIDWTVLVSIAAIFGIDELTIEYAF